MTKRKGDPVKERLSDVMPVRLVDQVAARLASEWSSERICAELKVTPQYVATTALWLEAIHLDLPVEADALLVKLKSTLRRERRTQ